jgi:hypothetical protein
MELIREEIISITDFEVHNEIRMLVEDIYLRGPYRDSDMIKRCHIKEINYLANQFFGSRVLGFYVYCALRNSFKRFAPHFMIGLKKIDEMYVHYHQQSHPILELGMIRCNANNFI